jgi:hypothetical protein
VAVEAASGRGRQAPVDLALEPVVDRRLVEEGAEAGRDGRPAACTQYGPQLVLQEGLAGNGGAGQRVQRPG